MKQNYVLYGILALVAIILLLNVYFINKPWGNGHDEDADMHNDQAFSKSKMTAFDAGMAHEMMDENNDGICDICGMPIGQCMDAGMLECPMGPGAKTAIGLLGSAHIHTDIKVYDKGKEINLADEKYFVMSKFIHVEPEANPDATGKVVHIHATGIPIRMLFESINISLASPRLYVNGEEKDYKTYVPKDFEKILVTTSSQEQIPQEIGSVTDYSKVRQV